MKILKFGGSSVGSPDSLRQVKKIVENNREHKKIIIVSAFQGITDKLQNTSELASSGELSYTEELTRIKQKHLDTIEELLPQNQQNKATSQVKLLINELENFLHGIYLIKDLTPKTLDYIMSFGEHLAAYIISKYIENAYFVDSRDFIVTDENFGKANVNFETTDNLVRQTFDEFLNHNPDNRIAIVPGFIASTKKGDTSTLGRGGSDYTAAIIAAALQADELEIWTDVDGFMTSDPRKVKKAYPIGQMSYAEAMELSHFGAKVIYTPTVQPVYRKNIPIVVKNTFNPLSKGTVIKHISEQIPGKPIKGIASIDNVALITIQGSGLVGVTGTSMRLFKVLAEHKINVILISQASSEHSISFAVRPQDAEIAEECIKQEFLDEIESKIIKLQVEDDQSIVAIVGENMRHTPGIAASMFNNLGRNGVNVTAIAQGSSELNISAVIQNKALRKALNVIHEGFFLSDFTTLNVFQVGIGTVGGDLLEQIKNQQDTLHEDERLQINVVGIADVDNMIFNEEGIDLATYKVQLQEGEKSNLKGFVQRMKEMNLRNSVFVDCTASKAVSQMYKQVLESYTSVVAANKIACSSNYALYHELKTISQKNKVKFLYETNVGAGLPVIKTISDLIKSGDRIVKLEAVLSGTLNYIFNVLSEDIPMSKAIKLAQEKGYSEPDPRIDLSGVDVLRKLLILSREAGYPLEKDDIETTPFLPEACMNTKSLDEFWEKVQTVDEDFEARRKILSKQNKQWKFVARLENGKASIQLQEVDAAHPFYNLQGSDNIILILTERYKTLPMIIKGAGAGAAVTATGVFSDIIRVVNI